MRRWLIKHEQKTLPFVVTADMLYRADFPRFGQGQSWSWKTLAAGKAVSAQVQLAGENHIVHLVEREGIVYLVLNGFFYRLHHTTVKPAASLQGSSEGVRAEIPGRIVKVLVKAGDPVSAGQPLLVQEAMKMEITLRAPADAVVSEVLTAPGAQVDAEALLITFARAKQE